MRKCYCHTRNRADYTDRILVAGTSSRPFLLVITASRGFVSGTSSAGANSAGKGAAKCKQQRNKPRQHHYDKNRTGTNRAGENTGESTAGWIYAFCCCRTERDFSLNRSKSIHCRGRRPRRTADRAEHAFVYFRQHAGIWQPDPDQNRSCATDHGSVQVKKTSIVQKRQNTAGRRAPTGRAPFLFSI